MLHQSVVSYDAEKARSEYLEKINPSYRSHVTNLYLEAARAGLHKPSDVLARVVRVVHDRINGNDSQEDHDKWLAVWHTLGKPEALDFAAYAIHYTALPNAARQRLKAARAMPHVDAHMEGQPPTTSQLNLLSRLGWTGSPPVENRAEASVLIAALLGQGGRRG